MADYWIDRRKMERVCKSCYHRTPFRPRGPLKLRCIHCRRKWNPLKHSRRGKPREKSWLTPTALLRSEPSCEHGLVVPVWDEEDSNQACPWAHETDDEIIGWEPNPSPRKIIRYRHINSPRKKRKP